MDNEQNILHEDKYPKTELTETPVWTVWMDMVSFASEWIRLENDTIISISRSYVSISMGVVTGKLKCASLLGFKEALHL